MMGYGVKFKDGVVCQYLHQDIVDAINWLADFAQLQKTNFTITSMNDSVHSANSFHYKDLAIDIRRWGLTYNQRDEILNHFNSDNRYDCVLESDHVHLEVDPK